MVEKKERKAIRRLTRAETFVVGQLLAANIERVTGDLDNPGTFRWLNDWSDKRVYEELGKQFDLEGLEPITVAAYRREIFGTPFVEPPPSAEEQMKELASTVEAQGGLILELEARLAKLRNDLATLGLKVNDVTVEVRQLKQLRVD